MYTPPAFAEHDVTTLHTMMRRYSFASLICCAADGPVVSHLPLLLDESVGPNGCLMGHMARANPQWKACANQSVLAVFSGPHAYISPTWYAESSVVPTWNYVAVHARGCLRVVENQAETHRILEDYVTTYERSMPQPWSTDGQDSSFFDRLAEAVVAFTIPIESLQGKQKLSQNHSVERQRRVIRGLQARGAGDDAAIAALMRHNLDPEASQTMDGDS